MSPSASITSFPSEEGECFLVTTDMFLNWVVRDGKYGLYLDSSLFDGSSAPCSTFNNEVLCQPGDNYSGKAVNFECVGLEVWGVGGT